MSADIAAVNIDKLREEIKALRNEIARLNNQTNWVCTCGGTDTKGQKENEEQARLLGKGAEREARLLGRIGELQGSLDAVMAANERAVEQWQAAHPGKELVIPDQTKMVEWLLEQNAALKTALDHQMTYQRELRADRDRLDWLMSQKYIRYPFAPHDDGKMLRERIDAAMGEGKQ